jgi:L-asparaginase
MKIKVLVTGGTLDKEYDELTGRLVLKNTHVPDMLMSGRCGLDLTVKEVMMVDSASMKDSDRRMILRHCEGSEEDKIVIIHGTDSMANTAAFLAESIKERTIVLTGALKPYVLGGSDGLFNLGSALAFVQTLPNGVYVSMHGKYYHSDEGRKNRQTGEFEEICSASGESQRRKSTNYVKHSYGRRDPP